MRYSGRKSQSGFTLVEIAIVLVIIGLLLGGVLKGTELIENSKVKRAVNEINGLSAAYYSYIDRYKRVPGDDGPTATVRGRGSNWASVTGGNSDGMLTYANTQIWNAGGEHAYFWQQVRAAGLVTGAASGAGAASQPRNAFGGLIAVVTIPINGNLPGTKVCLSQVPGKSAMAIDTQLDDGNPGTGRSRSTDGGTTPANTLPDNTQATAYSEDNYYTVCTQI